MKQLITIFVTTTTVITGLAAIGKYMHMKNEIDDLKTDVREYRADLRIAKRALRRAVHALEPWDREEVGKIHKYVHESLQFQKIIHDF